MPRFVIERELAGAGKLSDAQVEAVSRRSLDALKQMGPGIQWLQSDVIDDKPCGVYLAAEFPAARPVNLSRPARPEGDEDLARPQAPACGEHYSFTAENGLSPANRRAA